MAFTLRAMRTLSEILAETGTTDAALAERVHCDRSMITKIRSGKATPSLPLALAISRETGVSIEMLLPSQAPAASAPERAA
jgi:transcriptional regulator with XRE-family HTH domain